MEKFMIYLGWLTACAHLVVFAFGSSFEAAVVGILMGLVFIATGAALAVANARSAREDTAPDDDRSQERDDGEARLEGEA